jgi:CubicO group peptidase (beta-lactamase class C family)
MRRDSLFRIASMTKPIVAAATLMLIEEGRLRLDESLDRLLPELAHRRVLKRIDSPLDDTTPAKRPVTVEDLLTFRCGWGIVMAPRDTHPIQRRISELGLLGFGPPDPASPFTPDEWLAALGTLPLMAQPGEQWLYNTGSYILGVLLSRASRRSLADLLEERIFAPLGMGDTGFAVPPGKLDRLTAAYKPKKQGLTLYDSAPHSLWGTAPAFADGGAGLVSTVDDYFRWSRFMLSRGTFAGRRLLSEASIALMGQDHLTSAQRRDSAIILGQGRGWGFGMAVVSGATPEGLSAGAYGWNGGLGTSWVADPKSGLTAILLTQTGFTSPAAPPIHQDFWRAL